MNKIDVYCHKIEYYRYCYEYLSGDFCLVLSVPSRQTITLYCYSRDYRNGIRIRRRFSSVSYVHSYPSYCGDNCDCTTSTTTTTTTTMYQYCCFRPTYCLQFFLLKAGQQYFLCWRLVLHLLRTCVHICILCYFNIKRLILQLST